MKRIAITIIYSCIAVLSACINRGKNLESENIHTKLNVAIDSEIQDDTLFVDDKCMLFFGSTYSDLNPIDREIIEGKSVKIVTVDDKYRVVNFNNCDTIEIKDGFVAFYTKDKDAIIFNSQYADYLSNYYFGEEYDGFDRVLCDGQYIANDLAYSAYNGDIERVKYIISEDSTAIVEDSVYDYSFAYDAFYASIVGEQYDIAEYLICNGTDIDRAYSESYLSPLSLVAMGSDKDRSVELGKLLIDKGANVDDWGKSDFSDSYHTPIVNAIYYQNTNFIKLLIENNVKLTLSDEPENKLLMLVMDNCDESRSVEIISLLLKTDVFKDKESLVEILDRCKKEKELMLEELIQDYLSAL